MVHFQYIFVCSFRMPLLKWCVHVVHFILMRHLFAYPLCFICLYFFAQFANLCVWLWCAMQLIPPFFFSVHKCMQMRSAYQKSKNLLSHISVSRPAILDQPCCFLHIIETSLRLFNLYIWMTYRWARVFITMVTAWGEREWKKNEAKEFRNCVPLAHLFSGLFYSLYTVGPNPI